MFPKRGESMLKDNIGAQRELLVVVDMVRGFIEQGPLSDPAISLIIDDNVELIKDFTSRAQTVIAFRDAHDIDSKEFLFYPPHCVKGSIESEFVDKIKTLEGSMSVIEKDTTNGFHASAFQSFIKREDPFDRIVVIGCCTDICVLQFALTLKTYLQTLKLDTEVMVVKNAVETFDTPGHPRKESNEFALKLMQNAGILVPERWEG
jgi:nicotinamidase-related amidase